jgi:hypothetical protein
MQKPTSALQKRATYFSSFAFRDPVVALPDPHAYEREQGNHIMLSKVVNPVMKLVRYYLERA